MAVFGDSVGYCWGWLTSVLPHSLPGNDVEPSSILPSLQGDYTLQRCAFYQANTFHAFTPVCWHTTGASLPPSLPLPSSHISYSVSTHSRGMPTPEAAPTHSYLQPLLFVLSGIQPSYFKAALAVFIRSKEIDLGITLLLSFYGNVYIVV